MAINDQCTCDMPVIDIKVYDMDSDVEVYLKFCPFVPCISFSIFIG